MREVYGDREVHGRVVLVSGETVWLDPVERRYHLKGQQLQLSLSTPFFGKFGG